MPLLVIDVWEHAYYLDYNDVRAEFVERSQTAIDWGVVERRRQAAAGDGAAAAVTTRDNQRGRRYFAGGGTCSGLI